jgi:fatty acid CoA ligase FadD9
LRLERCLSPTEREAAEAVARQPLPAAVQTVLLTGANGFLGHVLCLEWLERLAPAGGKVYALVRAQDDRAAAARLRAAYATGDPELERRFAALAADHLEVLAGDFTAPGLGLAPATCASLERSVDLIVHAGALVNHVFTYEQLFAPNVLGTLNLIRFALRGRPKRLDYVSTLGVLAASPNPSLVREEAGVEALPAVWPLEGGYAHGYATSKWACEVLVKDLHDRFRTPVRVFRPGMILPHRRYRGQANGQDLLSRLLVSIIRTGLAPRSFHEGKRDLHYDGLPVDFIAASLVSLSSAGQEDAATYQVSNAHWEDGVSLDSLVTWVASAGYPLERVDDYGAWLEAFRVRLEALPPELRQHTVLPILHAWAKPSQVSGRDHLDTRRFSEQVRACRPGGEAEVPHLNEGFLHKYLADLRSLGLLPDR